MNLISVIVPIYKVERYLDKCVDSIVNQTYQNLEVILVDDGSPDQCPKICDEWAKKDARIKVIHKENGGLSDARNAGLKIATGEYISFVDSDDWIHLEMCEKLLELLQREHAEIVQCEYLEIQEGKLIVKKALDEEKKVFDTEAALNSLLQEKPLKQMVWNKLYKREILEDIEFTVGKLNEDDFFTYQVFAKAKKVVCTNQVYYYYLLRNSSIMGNQYSIRRLDGVEARYLRFSFLKENYIDLAEKDKKNLLFFILYSYQKVLTMDDESDKKKAKAFLKKFYKKVKEDKTELCKCTMKETIWLLLMEISLEKTAQLRNKIGIGC